MTTARRNKMHKSMNRPLTILGAERRLFFAALITGAALFNLMHSLLVLLCYKCGAPQKGQLESCRRRIRAMVCRSVAIEQGLCRSRRTGRSPRAELGRHFGDG